MSWHRSTFKIEDIFGNCKKIELWNKKIQKFGNEVERSRYKDNFYLYLKFARKIISRTTTRSYYLLLMEFMEKYYEHDEAMENKFILKFILFVYFECNSQNVEDIWFASSKQLLDYKHLDIPAYASKELENITLMKYRAHSYIAEHEIKRILSFLVDKSRIYSHIVNIVRKCINNEYDLSEWIKEEYGTFGFGNYFEEKYDEIYQITCPTYYDPNNNCNFKLLRKDINIDRSKRFLVNTVLIELRAVIDLHIDIEHENEIHDAINAIRRDKKMRTYILPCTQELLDDSKSVSRYIWIIYINSIIKKENFAISSDDMKISLRVILESEGISLYTYTDKTGKTERRYI